jgi:hypothetical protein
MGGTTKLTDAELTAARHNFEEAEASLACEGIYLTSEEEALFNSFEARRLSHDECRQKLIEFYRAKQREKAPAAT